MNRMLACFDLGNETYAVQRRPGHDDLVVNDGYSGLMLVSPLHGSVMRRVGFAKGYSIAGRIDSWCLRADGDQAVVFDDTDGRACIISLADGTSRVLEHPGWSSTQGCAYDWRGRTLWLKHPDELRFAVLRTTNEPARLEAVDALVALQENRAWRRCLDRLRRLGARCIRVEPDRGQLLYVSEDGTSIGAIGWVDQPQLAMTTPAPAHRVAWHERGLAILQEYEAEWLDEAGSVVQRFTAPEGFHFAEIETVPKPESTGSALVLVANSLTGESLSRFMVFDPSRN